MFKTDLTSLTAKLFLTERKKSIYSSFLCFLSFCLPLLLPQQGFAANVLITNVDDLPVPTFTGTGSLDTSDDVCVYSDGPTSYTIEVSGPGGGGAFTLPRNSGGASIAFAVDFRGSVGSFVTLAANTPSASFSNADTSSLSCSGGTNATIRVRVAEVDLKSAPAGSYSGSISITVAPV